MRASNDTTSVRRGEEFELAPLADYLRDRMSNEYSDRDLNPRLQISQFPGGHSNLTYLIGYGSQEFVLRRPPMGPVAPTAHDMPREYKLLSLINPVFSLAPKPILLCEDISIIGVPFYLMERRQGLIVRHQVPAEIGENLDLRERISETVVDTLVALHGVDIHSSGIDQIGKPVGFVRRQVRGWADRWQRSKTGELAEMDQVIQWLTDRIPPDSEGALEQATIVHNDFKLDNVMLDRDDPSQVVAVLDWEMCTVGDPLIDVGLFLTYWTMAGDGDKNSSLRAITNGPGWLSREQIIERYESETGRDLSHIVFYETFARFKVAVIIQQIYFRYVKGQTRDERFRNFDQLVLELAREALQLAQRSGI